MTGSMNGPDYGHRLVPALLDDIARRDPKRLYASLPRSRNQSDGLINVDVEQLAAIVNHAAFWLEGVLDGRRATVAYIGPTDLRYHVFVIAASKAGIKILLPSPRNTADAQMSLFRATGCTVLLHDVNLQVDQLTRSKEYAVRGVAVWTLDEMLRVRTGPRYEYNRTFDEGKHDPFVILHTSGSTGTPKPVECPLGWASSVDAKNAFQGVDGLRPEVEYLRGKKLLCVLPFFHAAGIAIGVVGPLFYDYRLIIPFSGIPPSVPAVEEMLDACRPDVMYLAPSMLQELADSPDGLTRLAKLEAIGYTGGPLAHHIGEMITTVTQLINTCGSTEIGWAPTLQHHDNNDWEYHVFDPAMEGVQFRDRGGGIYEQFLVRHPSTDPYHAAWYTFPDLNEFPMHDLYAKHPTRPHYWKHTGRSDDIIVFSNGEKINPVDMEGVLQDSPLVKGALIVGHGQFHSAALIELHPAAWQLGEAQIIREIWLLVEEANHNVPAHGRLTSREHVILAAPDKPFPRAGKGTIQRRAAVKLFAPEIETMFAKTSQEAQSGEPAFTNLDLQLSAEGLAVSLLALIEHTLGLTGLQMNSDVFTLGMDSLAVLKLTAQIRNAVTAGSKHVPESDKLLERVNNRLVYTNPTAEKLAVALKRLSMSVEGNGHASGEQSREQVMQRLLDNYTTNLPSAPVLSPANMGSEGDMTVVLTGSSGSLGTYILHALLTIPNPQIRKVYCLNRNIEAAKIQAARHAARGLETDFSRVEFHAIEVGAPHLGLDIKEYNVLVAETSYIIHNQWQVNFNIGVESFAPQIAGIRHLIDLAAAAPKRPPIFFTSSIGTASNWNVEHGSVAVPERAMSDWSVADAQGYSESKAVGERLLEMAGNESQVRGVVCRIGQIGGPVSKGGMWNPQEWLPSLIASSKHLRMIPDSLAGQDDVRWIPVDLVATIVVEMMHARSDSDSSAGWTKYYNLVNPCGSRWRDLVPQIQRYFRQKTKTGDGLEAVSFSRWIEALQKSAGEDDSAVNNPAVKLLDFYRTLEQGGHSAQFDTTQAQAASRSMAMPAPVSGEWIDIWLRQWQF